MNISPNKLSKHRSLLTLLALGLGLALNANLALAGGMSDKIAKRAQAGGAEKVDVIVQYKEMPSQAQAIRAKGLGRRHIWCL